MLEICPQTVWYQLRKHALLRYCPLFHEKVASFALEGVTTISIVILIPISSCGKCLPLTLIIVRRQQFPRHHIRCLLMVVWTLNQTLLWAGVYWSSNRAAKHQGIRIASDQWADILRSLCPHVNHDCKLTQE